MNYYTISEDAITHHTCFICFNYNFHDTFWDIFARNTFQSKEKSLYLSLASLNQLHHLTQGQWIQWYSKCLWQIRMGYGVCVKSSQKNQNSKAGETSHRLPQCTLLLLKKQLLVCYWDFADTEHLNRDQEMTTWPELCNLFFTGVLSDISRLKNLL